MSHKPVPRPDPISHVYWQRLREGRFSYQSCRACGQCWLPPAPICPRCWATDTEFIDSAGYARLLTWATYHRAYDPAFADSLPYVVGLVELSEGPRLMAGIRCDDPTLLRVGVTLNLELEPRENGFLVPVFVPVLANKREGHAD